MRKIAILASLAAAVALIGVTLVPQTAEAGCRKVWRNGYYSSGYCGRRFVRATPRAYVQPRDGYYVPNRCRSRYGCGRPYAYYPYWRRHAWGGWYR